MTCLRLIAPLAALLTALVALPSAASARMVPCVAGQPRPLCHMWEGKVTFLDDGDTVDVAIKGGGHRRVRVTGINAQELTRYSHKASRRRGECHGVAAADYLERLVRASHWRVRLLAMYPSSHSGNRARRAVLVKVHGRWIDAAATLLAHGDVVWLPNPREWAWNRKYSRLAERAAVRRQRLWNPSGCGAGPAADLRFWVNWGDHGAPFSNEPGEWVRVRNADSSRSVELGGWVIRTSDLRRYRFPTDVRLAPAGELTLHVGHGRNTATDRFWGIGGSIFDNPTDDAKQRGDGAYLFDPRGNLRYHMTYPCRIGCDDPLKGRVSIDASPDSEDEYVDVRNSSGQAVDLEGHELASRAFYYVFGA